ncbi:unnamed protein product [Urochloa humidicola]
MPSGLTANCNAAAMGSMTIGATYKATPGVLRKVRAVSLPSTPTASPRGLRGTFIYSRGTGRSRVRDTRRWLNRGDWYDGKSREVRRAAYYPSSFVGVYFGGLGDEPSYLNCSLLDCDFC